MRLLHREHHAQPGALWRSLEEHQAAMSTGVLVVDAPLSASIALYRGFPYAVTLEGWQPDVLARLVSAGSVTQEQAEVLRVDHPGDPVAQARQAVEAGLIDAEELAVIHQELLLSALGVLAERATIVHFDEGVTVDRMCAIPLELEPLLQTLQLRAQRSAATWQAIDAGADPGQATFICDADALPDSLRIPEVEAVVSRMASPMSVDQVAAAAGFTRAEALHIMGALVAAGVAVFTPTPAPAAQSGVWWTAEQALSHVAS